MVTQTLFSNIQPKHGIKDPSMVLLEVLGNGNELNLSLNVSYKHFDGNNGIVYHTDDGSFKCTLYKTRTNPCSKEKEIAQVSMQIQCLQKETLHSLDETISLRVDGELRYTFKRVDVVNAYTAIYEMIDPIAIESLSLDLAVTRSAYLNNYSKAMQLEDQVLILINDGNLEIFISDQLVASFPSPARLRDGTIVPLFLPIPNMMACYIILAQNNEQWEIFVPLDNIRSPKILEHRYGKDYDPIGAYSDLSEHHLVYQNSQQSFTVDPFSYAISTRSKRFEASYRSIEHLLGKTLKLTTNIDNKPKYDEEETLVSDNVADVMEMLIMYPEYLKTASPDVRTVHKVMDNISDINNPDDIILRNTISKKLGEF